MATVTAVDPNNPIITTTPGEPLFVDLSTVTVPAGEVVTVTGSAGGDTVILGSLDGNVKTGAGNDLIDASGGSSTVTGGAGNDYIVSGGGSDTAGGSLQAAGVDGNTFVFKKAGTGKDVIEGFDLSKDVLKLKKIDGIDSAKDVIKHAKQSGDNVVIKLGDGNKITLLNVDLKDLKKNPGDHFDVS